MRLTRTALDNRVVVFVAVAFLALAGYQAFLALPRAEDPGFTIRSAVVSVLWPGASAERVERLIAEPMERALEEVKGADHVETTVRPGSAGFAFEIEYNVADVEGAWTEMREAIADVAPMLPPGVIGPFINDDFGDVFGTVIAVTGEDYTPVELERAALELRRRILALDDARSVQLDGVRQRQVVVEYDPARLAALGLSTGYLIGQLQQRNLVAPGGDLQVDGQQIALRTSGAFGSMDDVAAMALRLPTGEVVSLRDLATVRASYEDPAPQLVRFTGQPAVSVGVSMAADGNLTEFGPEVMRVVAETKADLPAGLQFDTVVYQPEVVQALTSEFIWSLIQAIVIVVGVLLLALGVRTGLVVAASIPLTMFAAFLCMQFFGITINQMSLTALIVALGLLVDNSIVVSEQALTDLQRGKGKRQAILDATREMALPLLVASSCTVAALLPTYLAESASAEYTAALFEVLLFSLAVSWVLALTFIPVLCLLFLASGREPDASSFPQMTRWERITSLFGAQQDDSDGASVTEQQDKGNAYDSTLYGTYRGVLTGMVRRPWLSLAGFVTVLFASFAVFGAVVPQQFFPTKEYKVFNVELDFPAGTSIAETERVVADLERFYADSLAGRLDADGEIETPGVLQWAAYIGSAPPRYTLSYAPKAPRPGYAYLLVTGTSHEIQPDVFIRTEEFLRRAHPDVTPRAQRVRNGSAIDYPVEVRISGPDPAVLEGLAADLRDHLRTVPGTSNVGTDWGRRQATLDVAVDHDAARRAGLSTADITTSLQTALGGVPLTALQEGDDLVPVVLRSTDALAGAEALDRLELYSQETGQRVPFRQVAEATVVYEPGVIERYAGQRTITVETDIAHDAGPFVTPFSLQGEVEAYMETVAWPAGYSYAYGGDIEESADSQGAINAKQGIAIFVLLLLLVLQFNALRPPMIVVLTLPFAFIGVTLGMLVSGYAFGFMPLLGTIALFGILINNAVVLLDRIGSLRQRGLDGEQAVIHAAEQRLRPILLTAATTAGGLIPLWISGNPLFAPMAVAMLFGLVASSALTPGLVPVLYTLFYRLRFRDFAYDPDASDRAERAMQAQEGRLASEGFPGEDYGEDEFGSDVGGDGASAPSTLSPARMSPPTSEAPLSGASTNVQ
ncbi:MAG: efflux RND transporter permease subunit [Bacteroidota bacterium]